MMSEVNDNIRKKVVMITLTEKCNQNPQCIYCYEDFQSNKTMSFDVAKNIVDKELEDNEYNYIEFDFFGGEPFVAFNLLKNIYEYIKSRETRKKWICFTTTNGILVHNEIQTWLKENRNGFICGLSLDGTPLAHNLNRPNSYEKIDIDFFKKLYPKQDVKMTVSEKTLPYLSESIIHIHNLGFSLTANLALGNKVDWKNGNYIKVFSEQLKTLADFYLKNPQIKPCNIIDMGINELYKKFDDVVPSWCGAGKSMIAYDTLGNSYPCHYFMPLSIGNKSYDIGSINFKEPISVNKLNEECRQCILRNICPTCFGANYVVSGDIYRKEKSYCELLKVQFKASAYLFYNKICLNQISLLDEEKYKVLKAIEMIQSM